MCDAHRLGPDAARAYCACVWCDLHRHAATLGWDSDEALLGKILAKTPARGGGCRCPWERLASTADSHGLAAGTLLRTLLQRPDLPRAPRQPRGASRALQLLLASDPTRPQHRRSPTHT